MPSLALSLSLLFFAMLSIQFGASLAKQLFPLAGAAGVTAIRVFFAAVILMILWRPWRFRIAKKDLIVIAGYGASLGFMNLFFYLALERIPLGIAVALEFTGPLAIALWLSRRALDLVWAVLAALGIWFILPHAGPEQALDIGGILLALAAGVFWALYILLGQKAGKDLHGGHVAAIGMSFAALVTLPFGFIFNGREILNPELLPMGILVAVLSSALPYSLEMQALKHIPAKTFGVLMSVEPAIAAMMGLIFLREQLTVLQWIAIFCVIAASAGSTLTARRSAVTQT